MKKMTYYNDGKKGHIILDEGKYENYEYMIINRGTHPCAYICVTSKSPFFKKNYDEIGLCCHGGLTFSDNHLNHIMEYSDKYKCDTVQRVDKDWILGWDYGHYGDYIGYNDSFFSNGKIWTTEEIQKEVKEAIDCLIQLENEEIKKEIINQVFDKIYDNCCYYGSKPSELDCWEDLHDYSLFVKINGVEIEEDDELYERMVKIIKKDWEEMNYEINERLDEECTSYYGDPAFSSASDFWSYKMG